MALQKLIFLIFGGVLAFPMSGAERLSEYRIRRQTVVAGVQSVGRGGGFGEMQALLFNQRMWTLLSPCLAGVVSCVRPGREFQLLKAALDPVLEVSHPFELAIRPKCEETPFVVQGQRSATLDFCALYLWSSPTNPPLVIDTGEIGAWVLATRLFENGVSSEEAIDVAFRAFSGFQYSQNDLRINLQTGELILHASLSQFGEVQWRSLSLEDSNKTHDLTQDLGTQFRCETGTEPEPESESESESEMASESAGLEWSLNQLTSQELRSGAGRIHGDLSWICRGQKWQGQLEILFTTQASSPPILAAPAQLRITQRRRVN